MPHELLTGLLEEVVPKYTQTRSKLKQQINVKLGPTTETRLPPQISAPHWTTLGGQSNSMALETPGTFFFFFLFPKRSCSCFARELGGREDLSTCIHGASASANKVFPEGRQWTAATSENNDVDPKTHKPTHKRDISEAFISNKAFHKPSQEKVYFEVLLARLTM